jgi:hypothetical protein
MVRFQFAYVLVQCTERIYCVDICHHSKRSLVHSTIGSISQWKSLQAKSAQMPCGVSDSAHWLTGREVVSKKCNDILPLKIRMCIIIRSPPSSIFPILQLQIFYWVRELSEIKQILTWRILPSEMWLSVVWYRDTNVFEECAASIFRVECVE